MVAKRVRRQPNDEIRDLADAYNRLYGLSEIRRNHYVTVNPMLAWAIAAEYEMLPDVSDDERTSRCYLALEKEIVQQWLFITEHGYVLEPWTQEGQPYADSEEMCNDLRENRHLYFFTGGEPHPLLNYRWSTTGYTGNEMLRAIHDVFGHAAEGYGFGARGEENAWIHHSMMFTPDAQKALTTETRGQNSWVNFGPFSDLPVTERPYADQKAALLPWWCCDWRHALKGN